MSGRMLDVGEAWLTVEQIAHETALDVGEVRKSISELIEIGYLLVDGDGPLQRYRMRMPDRGGGSQ